MLRLALLTLGIVVFTAGDAALAQRTAGRAPNSPGRSSPSAARGYRAGRGSSGMSPSRGQQAFAKSSRARRAQDVQQATYEEEYRTRPTLGAEAEWHPDAASRGQSRQSRTSHSRYSQPGRLAYAQEPMPGAADEHAAAPMDDHPMDDHPMEDADEHAAPMGGGADHSEKSNRTEKPPVVDSHGYQGMPETIHSVPDSPMVGEMEDWLDPGCDSCGGHGGGCGDYGCGGGCGGCGGGCGHGHGVGPGSDCWRMGPLGILYASPLYFRGEYLMWYTQGDGLPPALTTSPQGTPRAQAGVLDQADTTTLLGNEQLHTQMRSGGRLTTGWWFRPCSAVQADYFSLGQESQSFDRASLGDPILARPFFNAQTGLEASTLLAFPGTFTGTLSMQSTADLLSAGVCYRGRLCNMHGRCGQRLKLDLLAGYRFARIDEFIGFQHQSTAIATDGVLAAGTVLNASDSFDTINEFHGAELGMVCEWSYCRWSMEGLFRMAFGGNQQTAIIAGQTQTSVPGQGNAFAPGGFFAQSSNIGQFQQSEFTMIPEVGTTLGFRMTPKLRLLVGYSFIYYSDVARPGDLIDRQLNVSQSNNGVLVGAARPEFEFKDADYWAQGINFGVDWRF